MPRTVAGKNIARVAIIDDDDASRVAVAETVAASDVEAIAIAGPLGPVDDVVRDIASRADALVSDHHLTKGRYAGFGGAEAVAKTYRIGTPAVLCTGWAQANIVEIRAWRRWIPMVVNSDDATDPEVFISGIQLCCEEFAGSFTSPRKPWRTLVRVEEEKLAAPTPTIYVIVTGWHAKKVVELLAQNLPSHVRDAIKAGTHRFHAQVNKGAEEDSELYFDEWTA